MNFRTKIFTFFVFLCLFFISDIGVKAYSSNQKNFNANIEFLKEISGSNNFIFKIDVENNTNGIIKEFFIEDSQKIIPVSTYEISKNKYVIVVTPNSKDFTINNVKLGATLVINRSEENIKDIGVLNGENLNFKSGQVISDPMLLYHDQDKITLAVQIDDPWDTLKKVQAILVYPDLSKEVDVSYEKKYVIVSGKIKQFAYISMKSFKSNEVLKFNINLLFQRGLDDVSLRGVSKVFSYNFDVNEITEKFIKNVYANFLERQATDSEIQKNLKNLVDRPESIADFVVGIIESNEFKNINMSDGDFLDKLYKIVFDREADSDGKNYWISEIKKSSRAEVLKQILKVDEYVKLVK